MRASVINVLQRRHPSDINANTSPSARNYNGSQKRSEKRAHKAEVRSFLRDLFVSVNKQASSSSDGGGEPVYAYALDCKSFRFAHTFSDLNICCFIPHWTSKNVTVPSNERYASLDHTKFHVFGAYSSSLIESISSLPAQVRPRFGFFWLDSCNVYGEDQDQELWRIFENDLLLQDGPSIIAVTYISKMDFNGPLTQDKDTVGIERQDNIALRVEDFASNTGYNVWRVKEFAFDGVLTLVFVVAPENPLFENPQLLCLRFTKLRKLTWIPYPAAMKEMTMDEYAQEERKANGFVPPPYDYTVGGSKHKAGTVCRGVSSWLKRCGDHEMQTHKAPRGKGVAQCGFCFGHRKKHSKKV